MYGIAIVGDIFSLIPFVGLLTAPITGLFLWLVAPDDENIFTSNRMEVTLLTMLIEMVPWFGMFPTWTLRVWLVKRAARRDRESKPQ